MTALVMSQITARLPDELVAALDEAAEELRKTRADVVRSAIEHYLAEYEDLAVAVARLRDPADAVLDWDDVRRDLLAAD
jgi:predicted DNA-binding protein